MEYSLLQIDFRCPGRDADEIGGRYYNENKVNSFRKMRHTFELFGLKLSTEHFVFTFKFPIAC